MYLIDVALYVSHDEVLEQFRTNFFGQIDVTREFLPHMRSRRSGTIIFMSSIAGWLGVAAGGPYSASKFALEGIDYSCWCLR